jgi:hypothetical protein
MHMHVSSLKVPNAHAMQMHAQEGHNHLFIFEKVASKTMTKGS